MKPRKFLIISLAGIISCIAATYSYYALSDFRHNLQERFRERHALLSGVDEDDIADNEQGDENRFRQFDSVVKPLDSKNGISWKVLAKAKLVPVLHDPNNAMFPVFTDEIKNLNHRNLTVQGFMFPLDTKEKQLHFFLSPYPVSCPYCLPAGPTELVEVFSQEPIKFGYEPISVKGNFELLLTSNQIQDGILYQMKDVISIGN